MCDANYNLHLLAGNYEVSRPNLLQLSEDVSVNQISSHHFQLHDIAASCLSSSVPDTAVRVVVQVPAVQESFTESSKVKLPANSKTKNPDSWKSAVRKRLRQKGESYTDSKGNEQRARKVQEPCPSLCRLQCIKKFPAFEREKVHKQFWSLTDEQKWQFYAIYVERCNKERSRSKNEQSRRSFTYNYYFKTKKGARVKVCKTFFLNTLDISSKRLYFFFGNVMQESGIPRESLKGKSNSRSTPQEQVDQIISHIQSFERLPPPKGIVVSSGLEFLDASMTVRKMYEMYKESYRDLAVKEHLYRSVLKANFNLVFIKS